MADQVRPLGSISSNGTTTLIFHLNRAYPSHWALIPAYTDRIKNFAIKYDSDFGPEWLAQAVEREFVLGSNRSRLLVGMRDGTMIGHALAILEDVDGHGMVTVLQYETDVPVPPEIVRDTFDTLKLWAKSVGARVFRIFAANRALARVYSTYYGFRPSRVEMRCDLEV